MTFTRPLRLISLILAGLASSAALGQTVNTVIPGGLNGPTAIALDKVGNVYVVNNKSQTLDLISPGGALREINNELDEPNGIAVDAAGNVFVAQSGELDIEKIAPDGTISTFVAPGLGIGNPQGLIFDAAGNLFVSALNIPDQQVGQVTKVSPSGVVSVVVPATAGLVSPAGMVFDSTGNLYVADGSTIFRVTPEGVMSKFATSANLGIGLAIDKAGNLYAGDTKDNLVNKITPGGVVSPFATGIPGATGIGIDATGRLFVGAETANLVDAISTAGTVTPFFANILNGPSGIVSDGKGGFFVASAVEGKVFKLGANGALVLISDGFKNPFALALDAAGTLFVADSGTNSITTLAPDGTITPFVAQISGPMVFAPNGNLYVVAFAPQSFGGEIVQVTPAGVTSNFAAPGTIVVPESIAADQAGNLFAAVNGGTEGQAILKITPAGTVSTFASGLFNIAGPIVVEANGDLIVASGLSLTRFAAATGAATPVPNVTLPGPFDSMAMDPAGNLYGTDSSDNLVAQVVLSPSPLASAVLPGGRSVETGAPATVFATMINGTANALDGCQILLPNNAPASLTLDYRPTDPATNAVIGTLDTPVTIPANGSQTFVIGFTDSTAVSAPALAPFFACDSVTQAPVTIGVNTVDLTFSATPIADIIALSATASGNGVVTVPFSKGSGGAFALATVNAGAGAALTAITDTGSASLPITVTLCQTVPATGACMAAPSASVPVTIAGGATPTFSVFVKASAAVPFAPGTSRVFVRFLDSSGLSHGSTSVAVETD
jgi:sugar lactone lactonase YvrE